MTFYVCIGPYDAIHVGAASERVPDALVDQLKAPGRMFIPVGGVYNQAIWQVEKDVDGKVTKKELMGVMVSVQYSGIPLILTTDMLSICDADADVFFISHWIMIYSNANILLQYVPLTDAEKQKRGY